MKLLNQITIKNLKLNKRRTFMTMLGISLSVALIFTVLTMILSLRDAGLKVSFHENGDQDIQVQNGGKYQDLLSHNRDVRDLRAIKTLGYSRLENRNEWMPYIRLMAVKKEDFKKFDISLIEGRLPENSSEIVISEKINKNINDKIKVSSNIDLNLSKRTIAEADILEEYGKIDKDNVIGQLLDKEKLQTFSKETYKVVGIIRRPNQSIESIDEAGYSAFSLDDGKNPGIYTNLFYKLDNYKNLEKHINAVYGGRDRQGLIVDDDIIAIKNMDLRNSQIMMLFILVLILIFIIMVTSILIIRNSFSISIVERTKEFGVLKSLGATDRQIRNNIVFEGMSIGVVASVFGLLIGGLASRVLIYIVNKLLDVEKFLEGISFELSISLPVILISLALGFITILLSSLYVAKRAYKLSPIQAIRSSEDIKIRKKDVKSPKFIKKLFGVSGLISYKNLRRNRKKYRTTVVSLAMSVAVFIGMFSFVEMLKAAAFADWDINYQIVSSTSSDEEMVKKHFEESKKLAKSILQKGNYAVLKSSNIEIKLKGLNEDYINLLKEQGDELERSTAIVDLVEIDSESFDRLLSMNKLDKSSQALIVNKLAIKDDDNKLQEYKILDGDKISFNSSNHGEKENYVDLNVKEIDKLLPGISNYNRKINFEIYVRENSLEKKPESFSSSIFVSSNEPDKTYDEMRTYLTENGLENFNLFNIHEEVRMNNSVLLLVQIFGYGFIAVISLIGLTNVFNTITSNIYSRKREFGSLMSYGMTSRQLYRMSLFESIMIGSKALIWGVPIGLAISFLVHRVIGMEMGLAYIFPMKAVLISLVTVFVITLLIMNYSLSKIKSANVIETIRNENI